MAHSTATGIAAHIAVTNGEPTTTTQDIAEVYGKRHDRVMAIVRQRMSEAGEWGHHRRGRGCAAAARAVHLPA